MFTDKNFLAESCQVLADQPNLDNAVDVTLFLARAMLWEHGPILTVAYFGPRALWWAYGALARNVPKATLAKLGSAKIRDVTAAAVLTCRHTISAPIGRVEPYLVDARLEGCEAPVGWSKYREVFDQTEFDPSPVPLHDLGRKILEAIPERWNIILERAREASTSPAASVVFEDAPVRCWAPLDVPHRTLAGPEQPLAIPSVKSLEDFQADYLRRDIWSPTPSLTSDSESDTEVFPLPSPNLKAWAPLSVPDRTLPGSEQPLPTTPIDSHPDVADLEDNTVEPKEHIDGDMSLPALPASSAATGGAEPQHASKASRSKEVNVAIGGAEPRHAFPASGSAAPASQSPSTAPFRPRVSFLRATSDTPHPFAPAPRYPQRSVSAPEPTAAAKPKAKFGKKVKAFFRKLF